MVNKLIDCNLDSNEVQLKDTTRIQLQINKSTNQLDQLNKQELKSIKLVEKNDSKLDELNQFSSIENSNHQSLNDHQTNLTNEQIKRTKLNDEIKLYDSVLSSFLANEVNLNDNLPNENQFLNCPTTNLTTTPNENNLVNELTTTSNGALIGDFENSIELNESDCDNNQLNNFNQTNSLQNDPFLFFLPYNHFSTTIANTTATNSNTTIPTKSIQLNSSSIITNSMNSINHSESNQQQSSSNLTKMLLPNNQDKQQLTKTSTSDLRNCVMIDQANLDNQSDIFQQFNNHNSPSDFIKLDQDEQINKPINTSINSSIDSIINEKRLLSSQKLNGEDLLFSLTSDDLNDVANYFPFLNTDLTKDKFNCSPSFDSLNSGDSMFCSSVWDSPPSSNSSNNSSLNNDLDLPFILSSDCSNDLSSGKQTTEQSFLDSEFPFLSEDSIFDSFVNSNLNDLINTDEFFNEKCSLNDDLQFENNNLNGFFNGFNCGGFQSDHSTLTKTRKPVCTLSKDSNLAKLLKEKLPIKLSSQSSNQLNQKSDNHQTKKNKVDSLNVNNNVNNSINSTTTTTSLTTSSTNSLPTITTNNSTCKDTNDLKKNNGLITARKFTIQGLNVTGDDKAKNCLSTVSTGCLQARSIKIIDPVGVQVAGNGNVKYLVNNITSQNGQTTANGASFSCLNLTPANCLTVTTNATSTNLTNTVNQISQLTTNGQTRQNLSTTKSFIIKSLDGKFANGILYTPISRNGQTTNIAYASNLTANNLSTTTNAVASTANGLTTNQNGDKTKIMAAFTPNSLFINNRKLVQKRPYSSMSVSISNNSTNTTNSQSITKDFYSIDFVPKQQFTTNTSLETTTDTKFSSSNDFSLEIKKKFKTLDTTNQQTTNKNYTSTTKLPTNSVLLNLLLNGEDISNGYLKSNAYKRCNQSIYKLQQSTTRIA